MVMYVVYQNTDLTEGKGSERPIAWFASEWDAFDFAKDKGVMGFRATVDEAHNKGSADYPFGPIYLQPASNTGKMHDESHREHLAALERAKAAGLSEDDISKLQITGRHHG